MQTPMRAQHHTSVPIAPIVYSPERNKINGIEEMAKSSNKKQKKRHAGIKHMEKMQKCQKTVVNHSAVNNLFHFIWNRFFDSISLDLYDIKMSRFDTIVHSANNHGGGNNRQKLDFEPFDKTVETKLFHSTHQLLTYEHHRLLLEEMMLLEPGSVFTCAISSKHYFLKQYHSASLIKKCLLQSPTSPLVQEQNVYFTFNLLVRSNPKLNEFA